MYGSQRCEYTAVECLEAVRILVPSLLSLLRQALVSQSECYFQLTN
jgi:hypothetical protein